MGLIKTVSSKYGQQKAAARNLWVSGSGVEWLLCQIFTKFSDNDDNDTALNC